jgi:serine/threonine protein kinase
MPAPATINNLLEYIQKSGLYDKGKLQEYLSKIDHADDLPPAMLAQRMVSDGFLTPFQAKHLLKGRYRNFFIGKFKVLEPLGSGGMSHVYLCEHAVMRHRVAMKLLPIKEGDDQSSVTRFMREARAAAAVNHPNVVRAHDFDLAEKKFYYLIMDFVDGCNLHDLVKKLGPLPPMQAANYISQAAHGLNHILECGLIHRDLKPSNLLLDRSGTIRILDLGLARFTGDDSDNLTRQIQGKSILGTADFLAPEQAIQADRIDIRADIYSLGATLYFLLTGRAPFESQSVPQKLLSHQVRKPDAMTDVPEGLANICMKMLEKKAEDRYQTPNDVIEALAEWTTDVMPTPPEDWFQLRAGGIAGGSGNSGISGMVKPPPSTSAMTPMTTPVRMAQSHRPAPETGVGTSTPTPRSVRIPPQPNQAAMPAAAAKPGPEPRQTLPTDWSSRTVWIAVGIGLVAALFFGMIIGMIVAFGGR